jgi:hypothetical protein
MIAVAISYRARAAGFQVWTAARRLVRDHCYPEPHPSAGCVAVAMRAAQTADSSKSTSRSL